MEDGNGPTNDEEINQDNSSSEQPSVTNVSDENTAQEEPFETAQEEPFKTAQEEPIKTAQEEPFETAQEEPFETAQEEPVETAQEEPFEDMVPDDIDENTSTNGDQCGGMDNMHNEAELNDISKSDGNVENHNMSERDSSSQVPNMSNEREQEENDISDEDDDEILNRSAFDLNPASSDISLPVDTNNELIIKGADEVIEDLSHPNNKTEDDTVIFQNDKHETQNPNLK